MEWSMSLAKLASWVWSLIIIYNYHNLSISHHPLIPATGPSWPMVRAMPRYVSPAVSCRQALSAVEPLRKIVTFYIFV